MANPRKQGKLPPGCHLKGRYYYRVVYAGIQNGKVKHRWIKLSRVVEGLPALYHALAQLGDRPGKVDIGVPARITAWLRDALPGLSVAEQKETMRMAGIISRTFVNFTTQNVQAKHVYTFVQQWIKQEKLRTAQAYLSKLNKFFKWAIIQGDRQDNPCDPVSVPSPAPNMRYMDDDAFVWIREKLLGDPGHKAASGEMMQVYVDLAYLTGHGGIDIRTLRWAQIDEARGMIPVTRSKVKKKTAKTVDILITPPIGDVLERAKRLTKEKARISPFVVHNLDGSAYTAAGISTAWRRARERAFNEHKERPDLLEFTVRDLRAKFASDAKAAGYTDEQIAGGMAHVDTSMTTLYFKKRMAMRSEIELELPKNGDAGS